MLQMEKDLNELDIDIALLRRPGLKALKFLDGGIRNDARNPVARRVEFFLSTSPEITVGSLPFAERSVFFHGAKGDRN